jgi:hypothetical protein
MFFMERRPSPVIAMLNQASLHLSERKLFGGAPQASEPEKPQLHEKRESQVVISGVARPHVVLGTTSSTNRVHDVCRQRVDVGDKLD